MVAQQTLTLFVRVRILLPQPCFQLGLIEGWSMKNKKEFPFILDALLNILFFVDFFRSSISYGICATGTVLNLGVLICWIIRIFCRIHLYKWRNQTC